MFFAFALPIYAIYAAIMLVLCVVAYVALRRHGVFADYRDERTWKHYVALAAQWALRLTIIFFVLSGAAAALLWLFYYGPLHR